MRDRHPHDVAHPIILLLLRNLLQTILMPLDRIFELLNLLLVELLVGDFLLL